MLTPETKIEQVNKVGPNYLKKLQKLKIDTVRDLFFHFPYRYDDFSKISLINQLKEGETATIQGEITQTKNTRIFPRRMTLTETLIEDQTGTIKAIWFNQPYLSEILKKGKRINLSGKLVFRKKVLCLSNPAYELIYGNEETTHTGRLVPIYHETAGLTSRYLRYLIKPLLHLTNQFNDFLPDLIKKEFNLINSSQALNQIHFPKNFAYAQKARERLAFNELFLTQLSTLKQKEELEKEKSTPIPFNQELIKSFVNKLPFKLTNDQRISAWEILQDLEKTNPMNRLLDGDVGSGKTIIALMAALEVAKEGYQVALMAPTEILAKQHYQTFKTFLKGQKLRITLLTGSTEKKNEIKKKIKEGKISLIIGTHALIQKDTSFKNLALAIVDEQHRFGVLQRASLQKGIHQIPDGLKSIPHLLSMTATPIPRTLTLTIYGDLDVSLIKEKPKGRKKIVTKIIPPNQRKKTYDFIREQVQEKKQVFVICPLIDDSEKLEVKSVTKEYERLKKEIFPDLKICMLHGKMKPKEKEEIMSNFKKRKADILVSTSVIEVGVDIPNATVMMIEGPDRFGLAQLHQFRGRIGRGQDQSYCFLLTESNTRENNQRLKALVDCQDGFELAEKDLQIRGPGDFTGLRQSGLPNLAMASLSNLELIKKSRKAAQLVLEKNLINSELKKELDKVEKVIHLE